MALPFIVGPISAPSLMALMAGHKWKLSRGYIQLPLAEFFDALLLSLADQRPLFQQSEYGTAQASLAPVTAGLQTGGHTGPMPRGEAPPYRKAASCARQRGLFEERECVLPSMLPKWTQLMRSS